jgi:small-conductance mechanosensitive channel
MTPFFDAHPSLRNVLYVIVILAVTAAAARLLKRLLIKLGERIDRREKKVTSKVSQKMLGKLLISIIYILGIITAVNQIPSLNRTLTTVLAGSGILAVVVGFAAQESFGNLVSGFFLSIFKPFDVGDMVRIDAENVAGFVEDITLRHTVIRTAAGTRQIIPNSLMGSAIVENVNFLDNEPTLIPIEVDVAYDTDLILAQQVMRETLISHPLYAWNGDPRVLVTGFGASGISLKGYLPIKDALQYHTAGSDARVMLKQAFDRAGITIPFQTVTIANQSGEDSIHITSGENN